jgi:hypothetical protein
VEFWEKRVSKVRMGVNCGALFSRVEEFELNLIDNGEPLKILSRG